MHAVASRFRILITHVYAILLSHVIKRERNHPERSPLISLDSIGSIRVSVDFIYRKMTKSSMKTLRQIKINVDRRSCWRLIFHWIGETVEYWLDHQFPIWWENFIAFYLMRYFAVWEYFLIQSEEGPDVRTNYVRDIWTYVYALAIAMKEGCKQRNYCTVSPEILRKVRYWGLRIIGMLSG